jgi:protein-S-isoprenylcysteine O-methyltransferase Ste14
MAKRTAALGSAVFFAAAPGVMAGVVPWLLTGWDAYDMPLALRVAGGILTVAGAAFLIQAFVRFVVEGLGTPAPVAPPERLVVGGVYRWVRNPMYVAVVATILGQALLLGRLVLVAWAAIFWAVTASYVRLYEEPNLRRRFGADYEEYCRTVRAWLPTPPGGGAAPPGSRGTSRRRAS